VALRSDLADLAEGLRGAGCVVRKSYKSGVWSTHGVVPTPHTSPQVRSGAARFCRHAVKQRAAAATSLARFDLASAAQSMSVRHCASKRTHPPLAPAAQACLSLCTAGRPGWWAGPDRQQLGAPCIGQHTPPCSPAPSLCLPPPAQPMYPPAPPSRGAPSRTSCPGCPPPPPRSAGRAPPCSAPPPPPPPSRPPCAAPPPP